MNQRRSFGIHRCGGNASCTLMKMSWLEGLGVPAEARGYDPRRVWEGLVQAVVRPHRVQYNTNALSKNGSNTFQLEGSSFERKDVDLQSSRGETLKGSLYVPISFNRQDSNTVYPCVIFCHGFRGSRVDALDVVQLLLPFNIVVFSLDFTGCGMSNGKYVSYGYYEKEDITVAINYVLSNEGVGKDRVASIALWGVTLGATSALLASTERGGLISALLLDTPVADVTKYVSKQLVHRLPESVQRYARTSVMRFVARAVLRSVKSLIGADLSAISAKNIARVSEIPALFVFDKEEDDCIEEGDVQELRKLYKGDQQYLQVHRDDALSAGGRSSSVQTYIRSEAFFNEALDFLLRKLLPHMDHSEFLRIKVQRGDYASAEKLAEMYNLGRDPIWMARFSRETVTEDSISSYLMRISDRSWCIQHALEREVESEKEANFLIEFVLKSTMEELSKLMDVPTSSDKLDVELFRDCIRNGGDRGAKVSALLSQYFRAVQYLDRLRVYETIFADFIGDEYIYFRECSVHEAAMYFAEQRNFQALQVLLKHFSELLNPYRCDVLSRIPETTSVQQYAVLLPKCEGDDAVVMFGADLDTSIGVECGSDQWNLCSMFGFDPRKAPYELVSIDDTVPPTSESIPVEFPCTTKTEIQRWTHARVLEIDALASDLHTALELLLEMKARHCYSASDEELSSLERDISWCCTLVFEDAFMSLSLHRFRSELTTDDIVEMCFDRSVDLGTMLAAIETRIIPLLHDYGKLGVDGVDPYFLPTIRSSLQSMAAASKSNFIKAYTYVIEALKASQLPYSLTIDDAKSRLSFAMAFACGAQYGGEEVVQMHSELLECAAALPEAYPALHDMDTGVFTSQLEKSCAALVVLRRLYLSSASKMLFPEYGLNSLSIRGITSTGEKQWDVIRGAIDAALDGGWGDASPMELSSTESSSEIGAVVQERVDQVMLMYAQISIANEPLDTDSSRPPAFEIRDVDCYVYISLALLGKGLYSLACEYWEMTRKMLSRHRTRATSAIASTDSSASIWNPYTLNSPTELDDVVLAHVVKEALNVFEHAQTLDCPSVSITLTLLTIFGIIGDETKASASSLEASGLTCPMFWRVRSFLLGPARPFFRDTVDRPPRLLAAAISGHPDVRAYAFSDCLLRKSGLYALPFYVIMEVFRGSDRENSHSFLWVLEVFGRSEPLRRLPMDEAVALLADLRLAITDTDDDTPILSLAVDDVSCILTCALVLVRVLHSGMLKSNVTVLESVLGIPCSSKQAGDLSPWVLRLWWRTHAALAVFLFALRFPRRIRDIPSELLQTGLLDVVEYLDEAHVATELCAKNLAPCADELSWACSAPSGDSEAESARFMVDESWRAALRVTTSLSSDESIPASVLPVLVDLRKQWFIQEDFSRFVSLVGSLWREDDAQATSGFHSWKRSLQSAMGPSDSPGTGILEVLTEAVDMLIHHYVLNALQGSDSNAVVVLNWDDVLDGKSVRDLDSVATCISACRQVMRRVVEHSSEESTVLATVAIDLGLKLVDSWSAGVEVPVLDSPTHIRRYCGLLLYTFAFAKPVAAVQKYASLIQQCQSGPDGELMKSEVLQCLEDSFDAIAETVLMPTALSYGVLLGYVCGIHGVFTTHAMDVAKSDVASEYLSYVLEESESVPFDIPSLLVRHLQRITVAMVLCWCHGVHAVMPTGFVAVMTSLSEVLGSGPPVALKDLCGNDAIVSCHAYHIHTIDELLEDIACVIPSTYTCVPGKQRTIWHLLKWWMEDVVGTSLLTDTNVAGHLRGALEGLMRNAVMSEKDIPAAVIPVAADIIVAVCRTDTVAAIPEQLWHSAGKLVDTDNGASYESLQRYLMCISKLCSGMQLRLQEGNSAASALETLRVVALDSSAWIAGSGSAMLEDCVPFLFQRVAIEGSLTDFLCTVFTDIESRLEGVSVSSDVFESTFLASLVSIPRLQQCLQLVESTGSTSLTFSRVWYYFLARLCLRSSSVDLEQSGTFDGRIFLRMKPYQWTEDRFRPAPELIAIQRMLQDFPIDWAPFLDAIESDTALVDTLCKWLVGEEDRWAASVFADSFSGLDGVVEGLIEWCAADSRTQSKILYLCLRGGEWIHPGLRGCILSSMLAAARRNGPVRELIRTSCSATYGVAQWWASWFELQPRGEYSHSTMELFRSCSICPNLAVLLYLQPIHEVPDTETAWLQLSATFHALKCSQSGVDYLADLVSREIFGAGDEMMVVLALLDRVARSDSYQHVFGTAVGSEMCARVVNVYLHVDVERIPYAAFQLNVLKKLTGMLQYHEEFPHRADEITVFTTAVIAKMESAGASTVATSLLQGIVAELQPSSSPQDVASSHTVTDVQVKEPVVAAADTPVETAIPENEIDNTGSIQCADEDAEVDAESDGHSEDNLEGDGDVDGDTLDISADANVADQRSTDIGIASGVGTGTGVESADDDIGSDTGTDQQSVDDVEEGDEDIGDVEDSELAEGVQPTKSSGGDIALASTEGEEHVPDGDIESTSSIDPVDEPMDASDDADTLQVPEADVDPVAALGRVLGVSWKTVRDVDIFVLGSELCRDDVRHAVLTVFETYPGVVAQLVNTALHNSDFSDESRVSILERFAVFLAFVDPGSSEDLENAFDGLESCVINASVQGLDTFAVLFALLAAAGQSDTTGVMDDATLVQRCLGNAACWLVAASSYDRSTMWFKHTQRCTGGHVVAGLGEVFRALQGSLCDDAAACVVLAAVLRLGDANGKLQCTAAVLQSELAGKLGRVALDAVTSAMKSLLQDHETASRGETFALTGVFSALVPVDVYRGLLWEALDAF